MVNICFVIFSWENPSNSVCCKREYFEKVLLNFKNEVDINNGKTFTLATVYRSNISVSDIRTSVDSHLIAFAAEEARKTETVVGMR